MEFIGLLLDGLRYMLLQAFPLLVGVRIGLTLADIDLAPPLPFVHRSAWTHGPVIPLILWSIIGNIFTGSGMLLFVSSLLAAYALHLAYDMYPKRWHGGARISLYPIKYRLSGNASFYYLMFSTIASMIVVVILMPAWTEFLLVACCLILARRYIKSQHSQFMSTPVKTYLGFWLLAAVLVFAYFGASSLLGFETTNTDTATSNTITTPKNEPVSISVLDKNTNLNRDTLAIIAVGAADNGQTSTDGKTLLYAPNLDFVGTDTFTYAFTDGTLNDTDLITVNVFPKANFIYMPGVLK